MDDQRRDALINLIQEVKEVSGVSSERQLAKLLGVTSTDLKRWTKERIGRPYPEVYERIADLLGLSMDEIYVLLGRKSTYVHPSVEYLVKQVSSLDSFEATQKVAMHAIARMEKLFSELQSNTLVIASSPVRRYRTDKGVKKIVNPIQRLLSDFMRANNIDISAVAKGSMLDPERVAGILDGSVEITQDDVALLSGWQDFLKEDGTQWEYAELLAIWRGVPYKPESDFDDNERNHAHF